MKTNEIIILMQKKIIIALFISTMTSISGIAKVQAIKAVNIDAHIGQGTSEMVSVSDIYIETGSTKFHASNKTVNAVWENNQITIEDGGQKVSLPFLTKTANNELNQYHLVKMNIDFDIEKHFKLNFDNFILQFKNNYFFFGKFHIFCERLFDNSALDTLEFCLTDISSAKLSSVRVNSSSASLLKNLLIFEPQTGKLRNQSKADSDIKNLRWVIEKNGFHVKAEYQGKKIDLEGTIHYYSKNTRLELVITDAAYSIFSIKKRIYKKLRSASSRYMSVDQNDVITIKLDQF